MGAERNGNNGGKRRVCGRTDEGVTLIAESKLGLWGQGENESMDKKVEYMESLIKGGQLFQKADWGGGDSREPLYDHGVLEKKNKRKNESKGTSKREGPPLKQRRVSGYFRRGGKVTDVVELVNKVEELTRELV